jgi:hypothetical protein
MAAVPWSSTCSWSSRSLKQQWQQAAEAATHVQRAAAFQQQQRLDMIFSYAALQHSSHNMCTGLPCLALAAAACGTFWAVAGSETLQAGLNLWLVQQQQQQCQQNQQHRPALWQQQQQQQQLPALAAQAAYLACCHVCSARLC